MNKEQQKIIDEVYQNYLTNFTPPTCPPNLDVQPSYYEPMTKEWFIKSIKERGLRGEEFSEKWGLKIEERELSEGERLWICSQRHHIRFGTNDGPTWYNPDNPNRDKLKWMTEDQRQLCDSKNIPTKLITLTYNNETIESYE